MAGFRTLSVRNDHVTVASDCDDRLAVYTLGGTLQHSFRGDIRTGNAGSQDARHRYVCDADDHGGVLFANEHALKVMYKGAIRTMYLTPSSRYIRSAVLFNSNLYCTSWHKYKIYRYGHNYVPQGGRKTVRKGTVEEAKSLKDTSKDSDTKSILNRFRRAQTHS